MGEVVDLSLTLGGPRVSLVPGFPGLVKEAVHTHEKHGRSNTKVTMSIHMGTHVDCPYHFVPTGLTVDRMPLERYMGPGLLLDLRQVAREKTPISVQDVKGLGVREEEFTDTIAVFYTGWVERYYGTPKLYAENPYLGVDTARYLVERRVRAVAVDFSVDRIEPEARPGDCPIHRILLGNDIPLIENLVNLDKLVGRPFELWALPIKIYEGDGAATRAIALLR